MKKYIPIDCNYYDLLLDRLTRKVVSNISFLDPISQEVINTEAHIVEVFTQQGEEFMRLSNGILLRLDYLLRIDGFEYPDYANNYCAISTTRANKFSNSSHQGKSSH